MKATRKWISILSMTVMILVLLIGCSGQSGEDNKTVNGSGTKDKKVTLNFIRWSNGPALDEEEKDKIKRFNASHPNIEVKMTLLPWEETFKKIELSLASNNPVDLFYWDVPAYAYYKKGLIKNLQPYMQSLDMNKYDAKLFEPFKFDNKNMYVAPENYQTLIFYYNKDLFDKAGVEYPMNDWSWDDVLEASKKLTIRDGDKVTQFGFDVGALGNWWGWNALTEAQGGKLAENVHEPASVNFASKEAVQAVKFLRDMIYEHKVAPDTIQGQAIGGGNLFLTGKIAMTTGGDWDLGAIKEVKDFKWGMVKLPTWQGQRATPYFMGGYVIADKSKNSDQAWEFIKWAMTENQETLAKQQSWIPVYKPALDTITPPEWAPEGYKDSRFEWMQNGLIGDIYHLRWREAGDKAIGPVGQEIWTNKIPVEEGLKKMNDKINEILQKK
ncbi:ABC transporter substrate-binding protein [Paenibacillus gansuensis]|uniref:ABC transporter substrate-binding protein n=1 Tax=Paenibacillus gansuensis TaxID=306542 RepID=A0ABW5PLT0_9BACL